jgi:hypothetical protein
MMRPLLKFFSLTTANLYSDKPAAAFLIDAGYQLVYMTVMGAILGGWQ